MYRNQIGRVSLRRDSGTVQASSRVSLDQARSLRQRTMLASAGKAASGNDSADKRGIYISTAKPPVPSIHGPNDDFLLSGDGGIDPRNDNP